MKFVFQKNKMPANWQDTMKCNDYYVQHVRPRFSNTGAVLHNVVGVKMSAISKI